MWKILLLAIGLVVLASTASAWVIWGGLIEPVLDEAEGGAPIKAYADWGLIDPAIEGGEDGCAPVKYPQPFLSADPTDGEAYPVGGEPTDGGMYSSVTPHDPWNYPTSYPEEGN